MIAVASQVLVFPNKVDVIVIIVMIYIRVGDSIEFVEGISDLGLGLSGEGLLVHKHLIRNFCAAC